MTGVNYTLFKFQSVLISPDRFVYARIFWRRLLQILQSFGTATSIKLAVLLILSTTIMSDLLLITSSSVWIKKFHRIFVELLSATCVGWCWYHGIYYSINPCSSSNRTWMYLQTLSWRSRYFVGERPSQPDMMWWMVSFSTRQIRHVSIIFNIEDMIFSIFGGNCLFLDGCYCWLCRSF